jgi:hypothetical protein
MRRAIAGTLALVGALLATPATDSAPKPKPRFTVSIEGTQRFEWSLDATRNAGGQIHECAFRGSGRQMVTWRTPRPVEVIVPPGTGSTHSYGGQPFLVAATRKRLVPVVGEETRTYRALQPPDLRACPTFEREYRGYARDCDSTNPFLPRAGVVVMRYKPRSSARHKAIMYSPVDVLLFPRSPSECPGALFDLRNYLITQLVTINYLPLAGGDFERRATKVVRATGHVHYCIDPERSDPYEARFTYCDRPLRPGRASNLTGSITVDWRLTFRRVR